MASLVLGAETPSQSVCVCVAGREGGCWDRQLRVPGPSPQSKEVGPSPRTTEKQISPLSLLLQKVISPAQSLPPPLPFSEPGTPPHFHRSVRVPDNSSRDRDVEPGPKRDCFTSDLSLPSSARTPAPPGAIRSDPPRSNRPAAPAPHLGRAAPEPTGHRLSDRLYTTHCPGAGIYIWLSPPPLAYPKKLLESWKRFRRAPWLPEGEKMPKTSPKPPRLPPLCLRAALPAPGSYCPLDRLGWGPCFLEPGHSWTPAPKFCSQGLESASHVVHTSVL